MLSDSVKKMSFDTLDFDISSINLIVDSIKKEESFVESFEKLLQLIDEMEKLVDINHEIIEANQGIFIRILISIVDGIIALFFKAKTSFKSIIEEIQTTSELDYFKGKHAILARAIRKVKYTKAANVMVTNSPSVLKPLPSIINIEDIYKQFSISKMNKELVTDVKASVKSLTFEHYKDVLEIIKHDMKKIEAPKDLKPEIEKMFNVSIKKVSFGSLFNSMNDFNKYENKIEKLRGIIDNLQPCYLSIEEIDKNVNDLSKNIKAGKISPENVKVFIRTAKLFGNFVFDIAKYFESYGILSKLYSHHEHHLVQIMEVLGKIV